MENNENFVAEQVTENAAQPAEQPAAPAPKMYSQEEVDAIVGKRIARKEAKIRKEYDRKYGDLENVLRAGTGKNSVEEMTETFTDFYRGKGVQLPQKPQYSDKDIAVLAKAEAEEIIRGGYDEVVEEVDRLTAIGFEHMTARDKAIFKTLAEHRQNTERGRDLAKIGVTEDVYNSEEFRAFAAKFSPNTPITDVYDIYSKTQPRKQIKPMGSMKHSADNGVKDFYSAEDIAKLTPADLRDPKVWEAVRRSMTGG